MDSARMGFRHWLRPPRHLLVLFLTVTIVPAAALIYLGWRTVGQDQDLERQHLMDRLGTGADAIATSLGRDLHDIEAGLARASAPPLGAWDAAGMLSVVLGAEGVERHGGAPLLYVPAVPAALEPPDSVWSFGEVDEFQRRDYARAADTFAGLAGAGDPKVRAGALLRLARVRREQGQMDAALKTYADLAALGPVRVGGDPAELVGRQARTALLGEMGRAAESRQEATRLLADLQGGRFTIDRATYLTDRAVLERLAGAAASAAGQPHERDSLALAGALDALWREWQQGGAQSFAGGGRRSIRVNDRDVLAIWHGASQTLTVWLATSQALGNRWTPIWRDRDVAVTFVDADGHAILGPALEAVAVPVVRAPLETHLPWTLKVASANPAVDAAVFAGRRRLLVAGVALVAFLVLGGGYVVARAVQKELDVARLQSDFVSAVSHEFRTPLTSIGTLTERLRGDRALADDRRQQYYDVLAHETERLRRFVETLLDFGRMEAGARPFDVQPFDSSAFVADVVEEFRAEPAAREHAIAVGTGMDVPAVRGDRDALGHALRNLLDNAAKYSPAGTPIDVGVGHDGDRVAIRVTDRGPGIPAAEQRRIFQKFVRGSAAQPGIKGTGVGLAMVEHIVRAHGGHVRIESEIGRGSTFTILLPAAVDRGTARTESKDQLARNVRS